MSERLDLSYLEESASLDFDECSISAGQASHAVHELLSGELSEKAEKSLQVLRPGQQEPQVMQAHTAVPLSDYQHPHHTVIELEGRNPATLLFIQPLRREIVARKHEERRGLLQRAVVIEEPEEIVHRIDDPILVALTEKSIAIPIATFAKRVNDTCSYVQIGQEMYDKNFVVTPEDENDPNRLEIIEIFRSILAKETPTKRGESILRNLILEQLHCNEEQARNAYEGHLVSRCYEIARQRTEFSELVISDEESGATSTQSMLTWQIMQPVQTADSRHVGLVLGASDPAIKDLSLYAVTRNNFALEVARMSQLHGTVEFTHQDFSDAERDANIQALLVLLKQGGNLPKADLYFSPDYDTDRDANNDQVLVNDILVKYGVIKDYTRGNSIYVKRARKNNEQRFEAAAQEVLAYLQFPEVYENPFKNIELLEKVLEQRQNTTIQYLAMLDQLGVPSLLLDHTGETSPVYEAFLHRLTVLCDQGSDFAGTFHNLTIGKTRGDIEVKASIEKADGQFHVQVWHRPIVLEGIEFKLLSRVDLDITNIPPKGGVDIYTQAARLLPILDALKAVQ